MKKCCKKPLQGKKISVSLSRFYGKQGRLAQLVQSVCLTSRGSGVRIPQRPQRDCLGSLFFFTVFLCTFNPKTPFE